jgi:hypothetical protein
MMTSDPPAVVPLDGAIETTVGEDS